MTVNKVDLLAYKNLTEYTDMKPLEDEGDVSVYDRSIREVIHFHTVADVPHSFPYPLVHARDENDLVAPFD